MLKFLLNMIAIVVAITFIIGIHELGHFLAAKFFRVKVVRFSIGFGKPFWSRTFRGTEYVLSVLPIGGYVRLLDDREGHTHPSERHLAFNRQTCWKKGLIILAGPLFNLLFAWFIFWVVFSAGIYFLAPRIDAIVPGSIAAYAGLKPLDKIIAVDDQKVSNWSDIIMSLGLKYGDVDKIKVTTLSSTQSTLFIYNLDVAHWSLDKLHPDLIRSLGIIHYPHKKVVDAERNYLKLKPFSAIGYAIKQVWFYLEFNFVIIWKMITGVISWQSLSGPIGILSGLIGAIKQGILIYCFFLGLLSTNLAVINLLPIPGLDGAQLCYILFEGVSKKPVSLRFQILAFRLGMILLAILITQAILNDLMRFLI